MRSLLLLTLFSGAAALVYEVVWMRWFRLLFGSTSYAASATLCAFFAGLAIGSAWFGRIAGRTRRPLRLYGWLEFGAAVAALWVPPVAGSRARPSPTPSSASIWWRSCPRCIPLPRSSSKRAITVCTEIPGRA